MYNHLVWKTTYNTRLTVDYFYLSIVRSVEKTSLPCLFYGLWFKKYFFNHVHDEMVSTICTYEMISGLYVVNIFCLNKNLSTVSQNRCSNYKNECAVFENGLWQSSVLEKFQDIGYSFIKNERLCSYLSIISKTDVEQIFCRKLSSSFLLLRIFTHSFVKRYFRQFFWIIFLTFSPRLK